MVMDDLADLIAVREVARLLGADFDGTAASAGVVLDACLRKLEVLEESEAGLAERLLSWLQPVAPASSVTQ